MKLLFKNLLKRSKKLLSIINKELEELGRNAGAVKRH